jgi:hypothetical protein
MSNTWFDRTWCSHGDESQKTRNVFFACLEKRPFVKTFNYLKMAAITVVS